MLTRRIGEAVDASEREVEAACLRIPAWAGRSIRYRMMVGGLSNQNWRVEVEGDERAYFLKVPGKGSEMYVDRVAANEAASNAHRLGIGPEVVHFDPVDGVEVFEFLEGYRACTNGDFLVPAVQDGVVGLYRTFHSGPRLGLTKTVFDMIDEHLDQGRRCNARMPEDLPWLLHRYGQARQALTASGLDIVPCFNDPMPGNFLLGDGRPMKLIDYEFASNNDRYYELGLLFGEVFLTEADTLRLIEVYFGDTRPQTVARIMVHKALADLKWGAWGVLNRQLKTWDFDYQKYGIWKFMRAREVLFDTRWDSWLRAV